MSLPFSAPPSSSISSAPPQHHHYPSICRLFIIASYLPSHHFPATPCGILCHNLGAALYSYSFSRGPRATHPAHCAPLKIDTSCSRNVSRLFGHCCNVPLRLHPHVHPALRRCYCVVRTAAAWQRCTHWRDCGAVLSQLCQFAVAAARTAICAGRAASSGTRCASENFLRRQNWRR
jgi:hypothetical protein